MTVKLSRRFLLERSHHDTTNMSRSPVRLEWRGARPSRYLGAVRRDVPVTYRITATALGEDPEMLFEETSAETEHWAQRQVDLSHLGGETVWGMRTW